MKGKEAWLLPATGGLLAAGLLAVSEANLLYQLQEQNLFLRSPLFFEQHTTVAGGLLAWVGAYLTQFFYYPLLGAGLLGLLWLFLLWLLKSTFRLGVAWAVMTLVPVACLLLTIADLGYWVYYLKLPGHAFVATVGTLVALVLAWGYRRVSHWAWVSQLYVLLTACVGYPLFGFYGLLAVGLMALLSWQTDQAAARPIAAKAADSLLAVLAVMAVPLVCYHTVFHETNIVNIYWTALPVFAMHGERYAVYYLPYVVLVATLVVLALVGGKSPRGRVVPWANAVLLVAIVACVAAFWQKDANFHHELSMQRSMERQQWQQVLQEAKTVKGEPTRAICLMQNLALFRLGRMEKEMFLFPNGAAQPRSPFPVRMVHTVGKMLYLEYGIPNYCYRWCMEDGVEYGWTAERLKLMAKCSLLNGEMAAAQRFLNMLKKTTFHKAWALRYEAYVQRPQLVSRDPGLGPVLPLLRADNFLTADQSQLEMFLVEHILSTPGGTSAQQELARLTLNYYQKNRHRLVEQ